MKRKFAYAAAILAALASASTDTLNAAPDKAFGPTMLAASVGPNGSLIEGVGVANARYDSTNGFYVVKFNRPLVNCSSVVSPVSFGDNLKLFTVIANQDVRKRDGEIFVKIRNNVGTALAYQFDVIVFCWR